MDRKKQLIKSLRRKLFVEQNKFAEEGLRARNTPFDKGRHEYTESQKDAFLIQAGREKTPQKIQILENVLYSVGNASNPVRVSNANTNDESFPAYRFLSYLSEPASKYLKKDKSNRSVVEYLAMKYYPDCKNRSSSFEAQEGLDIYLANKEHAVCNLLEAFKNRGTRKEFKDYTEESISHSITPSRFAYLTELGEELERNPESQKIIGFVFELPNNEWGDDTVSLSCDKQEIEELRDKYIKGYKKSKIRRELIYKVQSRLYQEYDNLLDAKLAEKGILPEKENGYTSEQRKLISSREIEVPDMLKRKQNLLEKISGYISSNRIVYSKESNGSDSEEIPF